MSWSQNYNASAEEVWDALERDVVGVKGNALDDEKEIVEKVFQAVSTILEAFSGHIEVGMSGHSWEQEDKRAHSISITIGAREDHVPTKTTAHSQSEPEDKKDALSKGFTAPAPKTEPQKGTSKK